MGTISLRSDTAQGQGLAMLVGPVLIIICIGLLIYVSQLDVLQIDALYFHIAYLVILAISAWLLLRIFDGASRFGMFCLLLIVILTLRLITIVRIPYPILFNPDSNFELQLIRGIQAGGRILQGPLPGPITGPANYYQFFPGLEILVSALSFATGIDPVFFVKYFGGFVGLLTVPLLACAWRRIFGEWGSALVAACIVGLSSRFIAFDPYTVHPTLANVFIAVTFFLICMRAREILSRLLIFVSFAALVITHSWSPIVFVLILAGTLILQRIGNSHADTRSIMKVSGSFLVYSFAAIASWIVFVSYVMVTIFDIQYSSIISAILSPELTLSFVSPRGTKPAWIVALTYLGFGSFGVSLLAGIAASIRKPAYRAIFSVGAMGIVASASLMSIWVFGFTQEADLFNRNLIWVYMFAAPLAVLGVRRLSFRSWGGWMRRGRVLAFVLLLTMLLPCVYHGVDPMFYDRSAPVGDVDVSLGLDQWQALGKFAAQHVVEEKVYGIRLAHIYVWGLGGKIVESVDGETFQGSDIVTWASNARGSILITRTSWPQIADRGYSPSIAEFQTMMSTSNVVFHSDDAVVLVLWSSDLP